MESSAKFWSVPETTGLFLHELAVFWAGTRENDGEDFDILEIGTSVGYSGVRLAKALKRIGGSGKLFTIESNVKRFETAGQNFVNEGVDDCVVRILGHAPEVFYDSGAINKVEGGGIGGETLMQSAADTLKELRTFKVDINSVGKNFFEWPRFDFAFLDATKMEYVSYLMAVLPLMKRGGLILADNCLSHQSELAGFLVMSGKKGHLLPMDNGLLLLKAGDD